MPQFTPQELQVLQALGVSPTDPAAEAMLNRLVDIKGLQGGGDPAFQTGSRFFQTRTGAPVEQALGMFSLDGGAGGELNIEDLIAAALGGGAGGGGGGRAPAFGSTQAGTEAANRFALEMLQKEQGFAAGESEKARTFERSQFLANLEAERAENLERLKADRQRIFTDMLGTDPVRAVLFALGVGGEILPGGEQFAGLAPIKGAQAQATQTGEALSKLVGRQVGVGQEGVTGLGTAAKSAAAFGGQAGGTGGNIAEQQKLLLSGFGVGAKRGKGRPGQSREETLRQIASVTPRGTL